MTITMAKQTRCIKSTHLLTQRQTEHIITSLQLVNGSGRDSLARSLDALAELGGRLVTTDTSTPLAAVLLILVRAEKHNVNN